MIEDKKPAGYYRQEVYRIFEEMVGRKMDDKEHKFLKALLMNFLNDVHPVVAEQTPIAYTVTCPKCFNKEAGVGRDFHHRINKRIKKEKKLPSHQTHE